MNYNKFMDINNLKKCGKCGEVFTLDFFFSNKSRATSNRAGVSSSCKRCHMIDGQKLYLKTRLATLEAYGGACKICGLTDFRCLQIDHINGGGLKDIKSHPNTRAYYRSLMPPQFDKYQILCANHNWQRRTLDKQLHENLPDLIPVDESYEGRKKRCPTCKFIYKAEDFYKNIGRSDGLSSHCKRCHNASTGLSKRQKTMKNFIASRFLEPKCSVCNEKDITMLQLDHVFGKGNKERKSFKNEHHYVLNLGTIPVDDFLKNYTILCANHNAIKIWENEERYSLIDEKPITGKLAEKVIAKTKPGTPIGSKRPNQKIKLEEWRKNNSDAFLARNEKISNSRTGKKYKKASPN